MQDIKHWFLLFAQSHIGVHVQPAFPQQQENIMLSYIVIHLLSTIYEKYENKVTLNLSRWEVGPPETGV
jgi:hypothetical protein